MKEFAGKTAVVTGAGGGIGRALALEAAARGMNVVLADINAGDLNTVDAELQASGANTLAATTDVSQWQAVETLSKKAREAFGKVHLLFNNAGMFGPRGLDLRKVWLEVLAVNTVSPARVAGALYKNVAKSQDKLMVFMSSDLGSIAGSTGGEYSYRSSKAALNMVVASLAKDLNQYGIRAVAMSPGWVRTDMGGDNAALGPGESASGIKAVLDSLPASSTGIFLKYDGTVVDW